MHSLNIKNAFVEYKFDFVEYENTSVEFCYKWATIGEHREHLYFIILSAIRNQMQP